MIYVYPLRVGAVGVASCPPTAIDTEVTEDPPFDSNLTVSFEATALAETLAETNNTEVVKIKTKNL